MMTLLLMWKILAIKETKEEEDKKKKKLEDFQLGLEEEDETIISFIFVNF